MNREIFTSVLVRLRLYEVKVKVNNSLPPFPRSSCEVNTRVKSKVNFSPSLSIFIAIEGQRVTMSSSPINKYTNQKAADKDVVMSLPPIPKSKTATVIHMTSPVNEKTAHVISDSDPESESDSYQESGSEGEVHLEDIRELIDVDDFMEDLEDLEVLREGGGLGELDASGMEGKKSKIRSSIHPLLLSSSPLPKSKSQSSPCSAFVLRKGWVSGGTKVTSEVMVKVTHAFRVTSLVSAPKVFSSLELKQLYQIVSSRLWSKATYSNVKLTCISSGYIENSSSP